MLLRFGELNRQKGCKLVQTTKNRTELLIAFKLCTCIVIKLYSTF